MRHSSRRSRRRTTPGSLPWSSMRFPRRNAGSPTSRRWMHRLPWRCTPRARGSAKRSRTARSRENASRPSRASRAAGLRILLTTARAVLERTRLPSALESLRLELRKGDTIRLAALAARLEGMGFERVPMVEDVAQFSVRGGIVDIYSFGMAEPVRAEFWGDEIVELRHFNLTTQRSVRARRGRRDASRRGTRAREHRRRGDTDQHRLALPAGYARRHSATARRSSRNCARTWDEAEHHLELARRRGEDVSSREDLFLPPGQAAATLHALGTIVLHARRSRRRAASALLAPEPINRDIKRLARLVRDGTPTVILCDNEGQAERLEELLGGDVGGPSPAALVIGVLHGGFDRCRRSRDRRRCACSPTTRSSVASVGSGARASMRRRPCSRRSRRSRPATTSCTSSTASASTAASRRSSSGRARRGGGRRVRGRRPAQRAALPHRPARAVSQRAGREPG